jgi:hypothetical protein
MYLLGIKFWVFFNIKNSALCPGKIVVCSAWFLQWIGTMYLYSVSQLVFVMGKNYVIFMGDLIFNK